MPRYILDISYDGTAYAGWQRQNNATTVQEVLENALSVLLQENISVTGAGRTDTGVHARQLYIHFDGQKEIKSGMVYQLNGMLPHDIAVNMLGRANRDDFHVRFDAIRRAYEYQVVTRKTPHLHAYALWVRQGLDWEKMNQAATSLLKYEDFASFCKAHGNNRTTLCEIFEAHWTQIADRWIFYIAANRFLRGMVRAIVGTLLEVGRHKLSVEAFQEIIEKQDRSAAGPNVSAKGLSLTEIQYPPGSWSTLIQL